MTKQRTTQSRTRTFTTVVSVDAAIETLWGLTSDVEALPAITDRFKRVELLSDGPFEVGCRARVWQPGALGRVWTVETMDEPTMFSWSTRVGSVKLLGVHELVSAGPDSCVLTLRVEVSGPGAGVMAKVLGKQIQASLDQEAADFAAFIRASPQGR